MLKRFLNDSCQRNNLDKIYYVFTCIHLYMKTVQMRISEDVHTMLSCLRQFESTSFNDVILGLIQDTCPFLPPEVKRIRILEKENPELAASEFERLKKVTYESYTIGRLRRKQELGENYGEDVFW